MLSAIAPAQSNVLVLFFAVVRSTHVTVAVTVIVLAHYACALLVQFGIGFKYALQEFFVFKPLVLAATNQKKEA